MQEHSGAVGRDSDCAARRAVGTGSRSGACGGSSALRAEAALIVQLLAADGQAHCKRSPVRDQAEVGSITARDEHTCPTNRLQQGCTESADPGELMSFTPGGSCPPNR